MRRLPFISHTLVLASLGWATNFISGEVNALERHHCQHCQDCDPGQKGVDQKDSRDSQNREGPENPPAGAAAETGFYQAPPRSGVQESASGSFGIRAGGFTLPEIRLRLPALELPSLYRVHHSARMLINPTEASWVSNGFGTGAAAGTAGRGDDGSRGGPGEDNAARDFRDDKSGRASREASLEAETRILELEEELIKRQQELQREIENLRRSRSATGAPKPPPVSTNDYLRPLPPSGDGSGRSIGHNGPEPVEQVGHFEPVAPLRRLADPAKLELLPPTQIGLQFPSKPQIRRLAPVTGAVNRGR